MTSDIFSSAVSGSLYTLHYAYVTKPGFQLPLATYSKCLLVLSVYIVQAHSVKQVDQQIILNIVSLPYHSLPIDVSQAQDWREEI